MSPSMSKSINPGSDQPCILVVSSVYDDVYYERHSMERSRVIHRCRLQVNNLFSVHDTNRTPCRSQ